MASTATISFGSILIPDVRGHLPTDSSTFHRRRHLTQRGTVPNRRHGREAFVAFLKNFDHVDLATCLLGHVTRFAWNTLRTR